MNNDMQPKPPAYKRKLYNDWQSGLYTKGQLMEKYGKSLFKVNLIIEAIASRKK